MKEIIESSKLLKQNLGSLIKKSGYRNDFIADKIGMAPAYFSVKKQRGNWTDEEVEKILSIIESEELEDYFLGQVMNSMKDEEMITLDELKNEMSWK